MASIAAKRENLGTPASYAAIPSLGPGEGAVPSRLQFRRHEPVLGIGGIILAEGAVGAVAGRFEIARERFANLIATTGGLRLSLGGRSDGARLDHPQQLFLDGVVDPQAAEGDTARLAIVEQATPAGIAGDVMLGPGVADRQLAVAAPTANETGEQGIAVLGRITPRACLRPEDAGSQGCCR